ncbi:MAG: transposase, partial [Candidatus Nitrosopolaris sp.]
NYGFIPQTKEEQGGDDGAAGPLYRGQLMNGFVERLDVEPVIAIRNNASTRERGCPLRREEVLLIKKLGYQRWKQMKDAGRRWIAEIVFSSIKRVLGEDLFSKKFSAQKVEVGLKIMLYNRFISL